MQAAKNGKLVEQTRAVMAEAGVSTCEKPVGALLYQVASKFPENALSHRPLVASYVASGKIRSNLQLEEALKLAKKTGPDTLDSATLESTCGVGVQVDGEAIKGAVRAVVEGAEEELKEEGHSINQNKLLARVKEQPNMKWADGRALRDELAAQLEARLGPPPANGAAPDKKAKKKDKPKAPKAPKASKDKGEGSKVGEGEAEAGEKVVDPFEQYPRPQDNTDVHTTIQLSPEMAAEYKRLGVHDGSPAMRIANSKEQLASHLEATGGATVCRFPPEPNGYLHIGHAKAMFIDFGLAAARGGVCYLRYDDTNPAAEKHEYIEHIADIVRFMGWTPFKVTYSSDYFEQLYQLALVLVKKGLAYVCEQTGEQIKASRERREPSPFRGRSVEENLREFYKMKAGYYPEGTVTLRLKMDPWNDNATMYDVVAYRVKYTPHPRTGATWCIYPSYDYTHCLVDSLEHITHSLCTLEFETRRAQYYWLLEVLGLYKPFVKEYSRLNVTHNVMSKRKLNRLVTERYVRGWDDPRLMTLAGLQRRGVPPAAMNSFCRSLGITRSDNFIPLHKLEAFVRASLDESAPRRLAVLRPLKVVITNVADDHVEHVPADVFPGRGGGTYNVPFSKVVYIEEGDFREQDEKGFFGLAPGKEVLLRYAHTIRCTGVQRDAAGRVTAVEATCNRQWKEAGGKPPKGVLNWVAAPGPGQEAVKLEVRLYSVLFKSEDPQAVSDYLEDLNRDSEEVLPLALGCPQLREAKVGDTF